MLQYLERYNRMLFKYENQLITKREWDDFCLHCLEQLMIENRVVLKKLKETLDILG